MLIKIKVKTRAKAKGVKKTDGSNYLVQVSEVPEKGRANEAVIQLMAEYFKISRQRIKIISGRKSKNKIIKID
jgi:uncharacterized protein